MKNGDNGFYKSLFDKYFDALLIIDMDTEKIIEVNDSASRILGYEEADLLGKKFSCLYPEKIKYEDNPEIEYCVDNGVFIQEFTDADGTILYLEMTLNMVKKAEKDVLLISLRNVNELIKTEKKLRKALRVVKNLSCTDSLTNLDNRRSLMQQLRNEVYRHQRTGEDFIVMLADIDDYKMINDTYGHDAGDFVLKKLARLMKQSLRKQDIVGRWGGDEFLFILPHTDLKGAKTLSENLRNSVAEKKFIFHTEEIQLTMTFGFTEFKQQDSINDSLKRADVALYKGKKDGKNRCVQHTTDLKMENL